MSTAVHGQVLEPIWHDKPETAKRVLQRMSAVFHSAVLHNWRERVSPCTGVVQVARAVAA